MKQDKDRAVRFKDGANAYIVVKADAKRGQLLVRHVTRGDLLESDWGKPLALVRSKLLTRQGGKNTNNYLEVCQPIDAVCEGDGTVQCECVCDRCEEHLVECIGCDNCTEAEVANN